MVTQVSSLHEVNYKIQIISILEGVVHVYQERMVQLRKELLFVHDRVHTSL